MPSSMQLDTDNQSSTGDHRGSCPDLGPSSTNLVQSSMSHGSEEHIGLGDSFNCPANRKRKVSKLFDLWYGSLGAGGSLLDPSYLTPHMFVNGKLDDSTNRQPNKEQRKDSITKMAGWRVDDIDGNLAADFDDSLTGLGVELGASTYNMSEALLALPILPVFKQEAESENGCRIPSSSNAHTTATNSVQNGGCNTNSNMLLYNSMGGGVSTLNGCSSTSGGNGQPIFQYVLGAATSIATKVNEETLTYLNQGQSYEIKLKKLGDLTEYRGKVLKSVLRVCFHERRLQYMEKEQINQWRHTRPGERILDIDIPLSYGAFDIVQDTMHLNSSEFCWDPTKETGVFVRVNAISTEFTPKKHGGEKGVPFRIQLDTYSTGDSPQKLHSASCQIKVFKPKGADRKHKTDREKMEKRCVNDQEKFHPSYDCTFLTECPLDSCYSSANSSTSVTSTQKPEPVQFNQYSPGNEHRNPGTPTSMDSPVPEHQENLDSAFAFNHYYQQTLSVEANASQTTQWLTANRFNAYMRTFHSFSGADILRLTREDIVQICGLADGIRLYNALHSKAIRPRCTMYICLENESVFHAVYLDDLTTDELCGKLCLLVSISPQQVMDIFVQGPNRIHVLVTDEVVRNITEDAMFIVEIMKDQSTDQYRILLKSSMNR